MSLHINTVAFAKMTVEAEQKWSIGLSCILQCFLILTITPSVHQVVMLKSINAGCAASCVKWKVGTTGKGRANLACLGAPSEQLQACPGGHHAEG